MKKLILLLATVLLLPVSVHATSGACSGHGGVMCSAGADSDGSVICMDGWKKSSVSFASMKMCAGFSATPKKIITKPVTPKIKATPKTTPKPVPTAVTKKK